uniref:Saposin B-type domain-containing protein n=1 Tax=Heterorhabditis bacteriophora TaxID=37862 RepID=A0A1I7WUJ6_HETBA
MLPLLLAIALINTAYFPETCSPEGKFVPALETCLIPMIED